MSAQPDPRYTHNLYNHHLRQAFSISEEDISANRAGLMVPSQQMRVESRRTDKLLTLGIGGSMAIVFACMSLSGPGASSKGLGFAILCGAILIIPLGLIMLSNMRDDAQANKVISLQGAVKLRKIWDTKKTTYKVMSQTKTFDVSKQVYEGFVDGETYILYYTPSSETLIAAEYHTGPIPSPQETPPQTANPLTAPSQHEA